MVSEYRFVDVAFRLPLPSQRRRSRHAVGRRVDTCPSTVQPVGGCIATHASHALLRPANGRDGAGDYYLVRGLVHGSASFCLLGPHLPPSRVARGMARTHARHATVEASLARLGTLG